MTIRNIFIIIATFFLMSAVPAMTLAQGDYGLGAAQKESGIPTTVAGQSSISGVAGKVVNAALSLIGVFFFILMVYAGIVWMKSMGASEDVEKSKEIIQTAITGLVIVSAAYAIANFVFTKLQ